MRRGETEELPPSPRAQVMERRQIQALINRKENTSCFLGCFDLCLHLRPAVGDLQGHFQLAGNDFGVI